MNSVSLKDCSIQTSCLGFIGLRKQRLLFSVFDSTMIRLEKRGAGMSNFQNFATSTSRDCRVESDDENCTLCARNANNRARTNLPTVLSRRVLLSACTIFGGVKAVDGDPTSKGPSSVTGWGYNETWEGLCGTGDQQSPVDFGERTDVNVVKDQSISVRYPSKIGNDRNPMTIVVSNNGHGSPRLDFPDSRPIQINVEGKQYQLRQLHFHVPSEHAVEGRRADVEAHLVHANSTDGSILVIGVLMSTTSDRRKARSTRSKILDLALNTMPNALGGENTLKGSVVNLQELVPDVGATFYEYAGSLTTPPCTEGVTWLVRSESVPVSWDQVVSMQRVLSGGMTLNLTARPLQPLHGRDVRKFIHY